MLSIRNLSRALPRISSQSLSPASRRAITSLRNPSQLRKAWSTAPFARRAAFSTSRPRFDDQAGSVDGELSAKFESELQLEMDATNNPLDQLPGHLKEYLESSPWQLHDNPGEEEVTLTRTFGKENIKITFTVADLNYNDDSPESDAYSDDPALYDEDSPPAASMQQGGAQTKGAVNQGPTKGGNIAVAPEDRIAPADREELASDDPSTASTGTQTPPEQPGSFPARLHITITKPATAGDAGALHIEALVRDGDVMTETLHWFPSAEVAEAKSAEQDWSRRALYTGPPFANLDEDLQVLVDRYVSERGIDTALAVWVLDYVDFKEQGEYVGWLGKVKNFIDA